MANIVLKNVNKVYPNKVHAVFDFNLEIKDKEFIVFVGPSGCGKSTTLRMIAGLEEISSGEYYIDGKLMNYVPAHERNVAMVFQNYALYPHMTVYRNMAYGLTIRRGYHEIYEKSEELASLLKKLKEAKKKLKGLTKKIATDEADEALKDSYNVALKSIEDILEEIYAKRKPVIGKDVAREKRLSKEIKALQKEQSYVNDLLSSEKEEAKDEKDQEFISMLEKDLENCLCMIKEKEAELEEVSSKELPILKLRHYYRYEIDHEVFHAAKILDLSPYLSRFPSALSGGQRQRVALGRAIVRQPKVFLMDEPLSNLDAKLRVQTRGEIASLHKRIGATTIYVTHDQTEAMTLADRIVVMKEGKVQQIDPPMKAFADPNNIFVAGFIGSPAMCFVDGIYDGEKLVIKGKGGASADLSLPESQKKILANHISEELVVGVRPEWVSINENGLPMHISNVELLGTDSIVYGDVLGFHMAMKGKGEENSLGEEIKVSFDLEKILFFDKKTTERIRE